MTDKPVTSKPSKPGKSDAKTRYTTCDVVHQYNGNEYCGSDCTLQSPHGPSPHVCGHGHSF
jgi:hypothetical protein